jgi:signal transduction histidine kinase
MKMTYITITTAGKLIFVWICWLIGRYRNLGEIQNVQLRWLGLIILFPLISIAMLILTFFNSQTKEDISANVVIFGAILAIANIAILYIITKIEAATKQEKDMVLLKQQIAMQSDNFAALENSYRLQRKSSHEFQRHLQTLQDLLQQNEYTTAESYLAQLQSNRTLQTFCINSHHPVIDVILNQKYQLAQDIGIKMQIQVNDLSGVNIQTEPLVVLLSNLLDNAIEACRKYTGQKEICCTILHTDVLYVSIRNTSDLVVFQDGEVKSSKSKGLEHGYGIPAVKYILDQLGAEYTFDYSDGWFQFVAEIEI